MSPSSAHERHVAIALLMTALVVAALVGEGLVRVIVRSDGDGQEWLRDLRLRPYHLPLASIGKTLAAMQEGTSFLAYDPELGWAPRPGARSPDGSHRVDAAGIRTDGESARARSAGVLRIAIFGDSFTFGDEVRQDETWGVALERALAARAVRAEVLNFGVNAYGMDQAYLRWRRDGRTHHPDVVLFGFQAEDALRNLNVFRPLYFMSSEVPLSKPRLVLRDGGLVTLNVPTIPPDRLPTVLAHLEGEPLLAHERFYAPAFQPRWWLRFRTLAWAATVLGATDPFRLDGEARDLALAITDAFARDAAASGASFLVLDLPRREDLATRRAGGVLWYDALLADLERRHGMVRPLAGVAPDGALFAPGGHYAPVLNGTIGEALADSVLRAVRERSPSVR